MHDHTRMHIMLILDVILYPYSILGIAIVQGMASQLGVYQYKCNGGQWLDVNISNSIPVGSSPSLDVVYLTKSDKIRFTMDGNPYWTPIQASKDASFTFLAWDMTNNGVSQGRYRLIG